MEGWVLGIGKPPMWLRPFLFISGLLLAAPEMLTDILGLVMLVLSLIGVRVYGSRSPSTHGKEHNDAVAR